jgi:hypothetical protein
MTTIAQHPIRYTGARAGTAPATFGQRDMWAKLAGLGPHTYPQNILQVAPVPDGLSVAGVCDVIRTLTLRHETLRTRFRRASDGTLWQWLAADGEIRCETWEIAGENVAEVAPLADRELERTRFDLVEHLPMRALIGTLHGAPTVAMIVMSHIAVDMLSARLIRQDLVELLAARAKGEPDPVLPPRRQPLDQAAFEATIDRATVDRSLASWRNRFAAAPPAMFPAGGEKRRFLRAALTSEALPLAADVLGHRYQVTTAVVVMAAEAVLLAQQAGTDRCALQVSVGNRIARDLTWATGIIRQLSLAVIDVRGADFAQVVRRTWSAWLTAQRTGSYDPDAVRRVQADVAAERGMRLGFGAYFNDLRLRTQPRGDVPAARIRAAMAGTRFEWTDEYPAHYAEFVLRLEDTVGRTRMTAFVDTGAVSQNRVRELLFGIERLLAWQATEGVGATGPLTPERLAHITGVDAFAPPPGWARIGGGWCDVPAARALLAAAAPGADSDVRETADGRLIGYVTDPHTRHTPRALHRRCTALLAQPRFRNAVTPAHYVVCGPGHGDLSARPVLAQGGGRP